MTETKFTPGPWSVSIDDDGEYAITKNGSFITYAVPTELGFDDGTTESNAALISAAPTLYEALSDLIFLCAQTPDVCGTQEVKVARASLAKARGES